MSGEIGTISEAGVVGTGLMGSGIAAVFAAGGTRVLIHDTDAARLENCRAQIGRIAEELGDNGLLDTSPNHVVQRVAVAQQLNDLQTCQLIMEAIPEDLELKHQLYRRLERAVPHGTILASNTSGLMPVSSGREYGPSRTVCGCPLLESPSCDPACRGCSIGQDGTRNR